MSIEKDLEKKVDKVFHSNSVSSAQKLLGSKSGMIISVISFIESALPLPILTDPFLVAAILVDRTNTIKLVIITTLSSVAGGVFAFAVAALFLDVFLQWMSPRVLEEFFGLLSSGESSVLILTLVGAVTPVPYTIISWVVAVIEGSLAVFIVASVIGRGLRYTIVGYTTYHFGARAVIYAKRYLGWVSIVVLVVAALFIWSKM